MIAWLLENYDLLLGALGALLALASAITKLTPSPKDDEVVRKILAWFSVLQPKGAGGLKLPGTRPADEDGLFRERADDQ